MNRTPELNLRAYIDAPDTSCEARTAAHDDLDFLLAELAEKDAELREIGGFVAYVLRYSRIVPTTISLDTMVGYAIGGAMPAGWGYPCDTADLARCEWVRQVAPAGLHTRMDEVLVRFRASLGGAA